MKVDNHDEFKKNKNEPKLILYDKGIPQIYEGNLNNNEMILKWINEESSSDEIEDITDEMLDDIIEKMDHVAVLFCNKKRTLEKFTTNIVDLQMTKIRRSHKRSCSNLKTLMTSAIQMILHL